MSAARTFTPITGTGTGGAFQLNDKHGYQTEEEIRQSLDALGAMGDVRWLGGIEIPMTVAVGGTYQAVSTPIVLDLDGDSLGGFTIEVVFHSYTSNAATSVTMRLRRADDAAITTNAATAAQGAAVTATSLTREVVTATIASGTKYYRLEWTAANVTNPVYAWGVLRIRKVPV